MTIVELETYVVIMVLFTVRLGIHKNRKWACDMRIITFDRSQVPYNDQPLTKMSRPEY